MSTSLATLPSVTLGRIQYINVNPVYYAFDQKPWPKGLAIVSEPPAVLNHMLGEGRLDISSVSAAAFARNDREWLLAPNMSIACFGRVMSVLLVSRSPFETLDGKTVFLTEDSATAVDLVRLLLALKGVRPTFERRRVREPRDLTADNGRSAEAGLVIGDAALRHDWRGTFQYVWDLCELWNDMTGLPFVFAVWAVRKSFAQAHPERVRQTLRQLHQSRREGLAQLPRIAEASAQKLGIALETCRNYFNSMYYHLSDPELACLKTFFNYLFEHHIIDHEPEIRFFDEHLFGRLDSEFTVNKITI